MGRHGYKRTQFIGGLQYLFGSLNSLQVAGVDSGILIIPALCFASDFYT
jgi:hypothetical protein